MRIKKIKFILGIVLLLIVIQFVFIPNISQAAKGIDDIIKSGDEFISGGNILIDKTNLNEKNSFINKTNAYTICCRMYSCLWSIWNMEINYYNT